MKEKMEQIEVHSKRLLTGAIGLLAVLAVAPACVAQQGAQVQSGKQAGEVQAGLTNAASTAKQVAPGTPEEGSAAAPGKAANEGIKVHGHWVLQVQNEDGTHGERREFNNSLVASGGMLTGDQVLTALLSGDASSGGLAVAFISGPTTKAGMDASSFCDAPGGGGAGEVAPPTGISCFGFYPAGSVFPNGAPSFLEVALQGQTGLTNSVSFSPNVNIVLSGNFTVPAALGTLGSINAVQTFAGMCLGTDSSVLNGWRYSGSSVAFQLTDISPQKCVGSPSGTATEWVIAGVLTSTSLSSGGVPAPLSVTTGQIVTVTVTLSFS